ncbi:MAG: hypothetical protein ABFQ82_05190 [Thermodesulfobacteriota bacterium]
MENEDKNFALDDSAKQLYEQLEGIDDSLRADVSVVLESELMEYLQQEERKRDNYRLLMAQAVCLFVDILSETKPADLEKESNPKVRVFLNALKKISEDSEVERNLSCRFRGQQNILEGDNPAAVINPEAHDYELSMGDILLDCQVAHKVEQREKSKGRGLGAKLMKAFTVMSNMKIFNFSIDIKPGVKEEDFRRYGKNIKTVVRYYNSGGGENFIVHDEYGQSNINLTLLAATNNVKSDSLQKLVDQLKPRMIGPEPAQELSCYTTVYDVIIDTKRFKQQLPKMPIEVNNVHQLMLFNRPDPKRTVEAVQVSRLVLAKFGSDPKKASEVISSISREGYRNVQSKVMGKRLTQATEFLELAEEEKSKETLQNEALQNIEEGLENVPDEVYDEISIDAGGEISSVDPEGQETKWSLHKSLFGLVSYFKQRSVTKKKVRDITNKAIQFDAEDYAVIAKNFNVSHKEAAHLVELLRECFSETGRFRRSFFEKNISAFLKYESRVFEFLWHYLKELKHRDDRVAFLNSIQILVSKLKKPQIAMQVLLDDIFSPAVACSFSDRNGLILANILLRSYNKEEKSNVELTPEEVLFVKGGLQKNMIRMAQKYFKRNHEQVMEKISRLIGLILKKPFISKLHQEEKMPAKFVAFLLREVVIFLSLVGGELAMTVVRGVVQEFGNPESAFYSKAEDKALVAQGVKLLQVAARGLKRFDDPSAMEVLLMISCREQEFTSLDNDRKYQAMVNNIMHRLVQLDG